jgi:hypothetical protein
MKLDKKTMLWSLPLILAGGYGVYILFNYFKEKSGLKPNGTKIPSPPKPNSSSKIVDDGTAANSFPLKKGVTNNYVKQLQAVLDVTPQSGYFGDLTAAALLEQTGKTQITSLADLNQTVSSIFANDSIITIQKTNKSQNIVDTYNNLAQQAQATTINGIIPNNLLFLADTTLYMTDNTGSYVMYISKNGTLNLNDYTPTGVDSDGDLILVCNKGDNAGTWTVDSSNISIQ